PLEFLVRLRRIEQEIGEKGTVDRVEDDHRHGQVWSELQHPVLAFDQLELRAGTVEAQPAPDGGRDGDRAPGLDGEEGRLHLRASLPRVPHCSFGEIRQKSLAPTTKAQERPPLPSPAWPSPSSRPKPRPARFTWAR